jgi:hypothetical protein
VGHGDDDTGALAFTLQRALTAAEALIAERDATGNGMITGTRTESEPPWNTAAAYAALIPHHEVRALETAIREQITGSRWVRGGSAANTVGAIRYLARAAAALPHHQAAFIGSELTRWAALSFALPAVDRLPQWLDGFMGDGKQDPDCPYCEHGTLKVNDALGIVACIKPSCPGTTPAGTRPYAQPAIGRDGTVTLHWLDGTVQTHDRTTRPPAGPLDPRRGRETPAALRDPRPAREDLRPAARA